LSLGCERQRSGAPGWSCGAVPGARCASRPIRWPVT